MTPHDGPIWYFGYGSNMSRAIFAGRRQIRALAVCRGRLDGYRLCFDLPVGPGERGVANVVATPAAHIWGVLYLLTASELDRLDRTEGVDRGFYRRVPVEVAADGDERIAAVTYQSPFRRDGRKPSARYLGLLLEGAREHGLPDAWIAFLESFELAHDERGGAAGS